MAFLSRFKRMFGGDREQKLGLVLGSGGARGLAHVGVLKVLSDAGIPIHCIVGTSAGAMVGGMYCAGTAPAKLAELFGDLSRKDVARMLLPTRGPGGIVDGRRVKQFIEPYVKGRTIEELSPRFACVATDLASGEEVVFKSGDLLESIRASISIPGLFTPVSCRDRLLVDGGVVDPLPIWLAFELGADFAVIVRVGRKYSRAPELEGGCAFGERAEAGEDDEAGAKMPSTTEVLLTTLSIYDYRLSQQCLKNAGDHILIQPEMPGIEILDFHKGGQAIAAGEKAMRARLGELKRFRKR